MTINYGCITAAILLIGCALTCAGDDLVTATIGGTAYTGQLRAETRVQPDRLVGRPGAKPLNPNWSASSERASMGISLLENAIGTISFPFPVAGRASINLPGITETTYTVCPMHIEKEYTFANRLKGKSYWFVSIKEPYAYAYFELTNPTDKPIAQVIEESADLLVGQGDLPTEAKSLGDDGSLCRWTAPRLDVHYAAVRSSLPGEPQITGGAYSHKGTITVPAKGSAVYWIAFMGAESRDELDRLGRDTSSVKRDLAAVLKFEKRTFEGGPVVKTPDEEINAYFAWTKTIPWKGSHRLPIGEPYSLSSNQNKRETVLNALVGPATGVWANDCVQTLWECSTLGPDFYPIIENTLESYYGHGLPESIEFWNGNGTPWYVFLKIGQQPEWVMGAANYLLMSGDRKSFERFWPKIYQVLRSFHALYDYDRDWLDDYSTSPFPEQPFTGPYNHEMLYASCYWYAAFDAASEVGALFGKKLESDDLRWQADQIRDAINKRFATDYGYASWLKVEGNWRPADKPWEATFDLPHEKHPHIGHNISFPVEYGIASPEQAEKTFKTILNPPMMTDAGPIVGYTPSEAGPKDVMGGIWNYNRWNVVHALYRYGHTEDATKMLEKWVDQESNSLIRYQAVEQWGTPTAITNLGFVWTAGRSMRSILFGLYGLEPISTGLRLTPKLPAEWPQMELRDLYFRKSIFDIIIKRGTSTSLTVDGVAIQGDVVPQSYCDGKRHIVEVVVSGK
ncbi:MAG: alpha-L-rhamnosidase-related protein [Armatimonadota bacterium]